MIVNKELVNKNEILKSQLEAYKNFTPCPELLQKLMDELDELSKVIAGILTEAFSFSHE